VLLILTSTVTLDLKKMSLHFLRFLNFKFRYLLSVFFLSGILANSNVDKRFSAFWRGQLKPLKGVSRVVGFWKRWGEYGEYGAHLATMLLFTLIARQKMITTTGRNDELKDWAEQTFFNFISYTLIQAISCLLLGGARPEWNESSLWRPCRRLKEKQEARRDEDNVKAPAHLRWTKGRPASGHAGISSFTATVGIKTLELPVKSYPSLNQIITITKPVLVFSAVGCALSRVDNGAHYLS
jgi:hypothetical protein